MGELRDDVAREIGRLGGRVGEPAPPRWAAGLDIPAPLRELLFGLAWPPGVKFRTTDDADWPVRRFEPFTFRPGECGYVREHPEAVGFATSGGGNLSWLVRLTDPDPADPSVYRLDPDPGEDVLYMGRLSEFLAALAPEG